MAKSKGVERVYPTYYNKDRTKGESCNIYSDYRELYIARLAVDMVLWQGSASVLKTTTQANGKVENSTPAPSETPERIVA